MFKQPFYYIIFVIACNASFYCILDGCLSLKLYAQGGMYFVSIFRPYTLAVLFLNDEFLLRINNSLQIIPSHRQGYARPF